MRLAQRLFLLVATVSALTLAATPAHADLDFYDEGSGERCSTWMFVIGHSVSGGCNIEFEGIDIPLFAYVPAKTQLSNCEVNLEARIDSGGWGYVTQAVFNIADSSGGVCTRAPCDENGDGVTDPMVPWPVRIRERVSGDEEIAAEFCMRTIASGEGGARTWCDIHLEFSDLGDHRYEIGHLDAPNNGTEVFCSNSPGMGYTGPHPVLAAPISIEPHFVSHQDMEIIHSN